MKNISWIIKSNSYFLAFIAVFAACSPTDAQARSLTAEDFVGNWITKQVDSDQPDFRLNIRKDGLLTFTYVDEEEGLEQEGRYKVVDEFLILKLPTNKFDVEVKALLTGWTEDDGTQIFGTM